VCNTAPPNSSAIRSQEALSPLPRRISSAASTSPIAWGAVARRCEEAGRGPGGAGASPVRWNHRWRVRSAGRGRTPCSDKSTRIKPAPQAGGSRRSGTAGSKAGWGGGGSGRWWESGIKPGSPRSRHRLSKFRTVRGARSKVWLNSVVVAPCSQRRHMACRMGRGTGAGMEKSSVGTWNVMPEPSEFDRAVEAAKPDVGITGTTTCRVTKTRPQPPIA
jgi:hypothetical protein